MRSDLRTKERAALRRMHGAALEQFGRRVRWIGPEQWALPTPCSGWNVRELVNHVTVQQLWLPLLLAEVAVEAAADMLEGDLLGPDPVTAWGRAAAEAEDALDQPDALAVTVRLWDGPAPAADLCGQLAMNTTIHSWDLARAIGVDEGLPDALVAFSRRELSRYADQLAGTGQFAPAQQIRTDADSVTELLALAGRSL